MNMKEMIKNIVRRLVKVSANIPYILAVALGVVLFLTSFMMDDVIVLKKLSDLLLDLSASLLSIPIILYSYEVVKNKIDHSRNKDISEYVKMNVDREIVTLLKSLAPLIMKKDANTSRVCELLKITKSKAMKSLQDYHPLVFYLATDWGCIEDRFMDMIASELIYDNLSVEERNIFVKIVRELRNLDYLTDPKFFRVADKEDAKLFTIQGRNIDPSTKFKERFLLMRKMKIENTAMVIGFNDIKHGKYKVSLTTPMMGSAAVNENIVESILNIRSYLEVWLDKRGNEILLDSRNFRTRKTKNIDRLERLE